MYRRSLFAFLDILGFGKLVEGTPAEGIADLLAKLQRSAKPDAKLAEMEEMSFLTFSDCTVRAVPLDSPSNQKFPTGLLWHELMSLLYTQIELIHNGYFIRGALTIGDISIDGATVFGPAIVRAYSLESEFAVYPRVVIDPLVLDAFHVEPLLRNINHDLETEREYLRMITRRDADGLYFVDYLRGCLSEFNEEGQEIEFLALHKERIVEQASNHKGLTKIAAKFLWLATYHNTVIRELGAKPFKERGLDINDFLICNDEMPLLFDV